MSEEFYIDEADYEFDLIVSAGFRSGFPPPPHMATEAPLAGVPDERLNRQKLIAEWLEIDERTLRDASKADRVVQAAVQRDGAHLVAYTRDLEMARRFRAQRLSLVRRSARRKRAK